MFINEPHYYHDHPAQLDIEDLIKSLNEHEVPKHQHKRKQKD